MEKTAVIDDQAAFFGNTSPSIVYAPRENWKSNSMCVACNLNNDSASRRLAEVPWGGTWTNAWWAREVTSISATTEFDGTMVAAYFIMFYRSLDPKSTGVGTIYFFVDDKLELQKRIDESEFDFQNDISPRMLLFQKSFGPSQNTTNKHSLRVIWTHNGIRPRVAVALDSIEYIASSSSSNSTGTPFPSSSAISTAKPSSSSQTVKIVAPIVSVLAVALLGALVFFLLRRRRQKSATQSTLRQGPRPREYRYVPTSQIEGGGGRRASVASTTRSYGQQPYRPPNRPSHSRDTSASTARGYIDPYPFNIVPRTHDDSQTEFEHDHRHGGANSRFSPTSQDVASPAQTNWSSFYTSIRGHEEVHQQGNGASGSSQGGTSVVQYGKELGVRGGGSSG